MSHFGFLLFVICLQIASICTINVTYPYKCLAWDTQCLIKTSQNLGYSPWLTELDALKVDPYEVNYFKLEKDGIVIESNDTKIIGLKHMVIREFNTDESTNTLHMKIRTDVLVTGLYRAEGSLFYLPLNGDGDYWVTLKNLEIDINAPYRVVKTTDGEDVLEVSDYKFTYDVKDNAEFRLNNFHYAFAGFNDMLHYLVNKNWKQVSSNYATEFVANAIGDMVKTHKTYFRLNPLKFLIN